MLNILKEMIKIATKDIVNCIKTNLVYVVGLIFCLGPSIFIMINFNYLKQYGVSLNYFDETEAGPALILHIITIPLINILIYIFGYFIFDILLIYIKRNYIEAKKSVELRYAQKAQAGDISVAKTTEAGGLSMTEGDKKCSY